MKRPHCIQETEPSTQP